MANDAMFPVGINTETLSTLTPEQQTLLRRINRSARGGVDMTPPGGVNQQQFAGLDPMSTLAYQTAQQYSTDPNSPWAQTQDAFQGAIASAQQGYTPATNYSAGSASGATAAGVGQATAMGPSATSGAQVGLTPEQVSIQRNQAIGTWDPNAEESYWESAVRDPMLQNWQQNVAPAVSERFIANNSGSSGGQRRALAESGRNLNTDMGGILANLLYQGQQTQRQREFGAEESRVERERLAGESYAARLQENLGRQLTADEAKLVREFAAQETYAARDLSSQESSLERQQRANIATATNQTQASIGTAANQTAFNTQQSLNDLNAWKTQQSNIQNAAQFIAPQMTDYANQNLGVLNTLGQQRQTAQQGQFDTDFSNQAAIDANWLNSQPWNNPWLDRAFTPGVENVAMAEYGSPTAPNWAQNPPPWMIEQGLNNGQVWTNQNGGYWQSQAEHDEQMRGA